MITRNRDLARERGVTDRELAAALGIDERTARHIGRQPVGSLEGERYHAAVLRLQPEPPWTAEQIHAQRAELGWTQQQAATALDVTQRTLQRWESESATPRTRRQAQRAWLAFFDLE